MTFSEGFRKRISHIGLHKHDVIKFKDCFLIWRLVDKARGMESKGPWPLRTVKFTWRNKTQSCRLFKYRFLLLPRFPRPEAEKVGGETMILIKKNINKLAPCWIPRNASVSFILHWVTIGGGDARGGVLRLWREPVLCVEEHEGSTECVLKVRSRSHAEGNWSK